MKRRSIFAWLFGGTAAAQMSPVCHVDADNYIVCPGQDIRIGKIPLDYQNGECPHCHTIAKPWKRLTEAEAYGEAACLTDSDGNTTFAICRHPSTTKRTGPSEKIVRCKLCNAAFWQDAEKEQGN